ncbi:MAG: gephyrin-like molybdotransferase Glp [Methylococcales bacterium]
MIDVCSQDPHRLLTITEALAHIAEAIKPLTDFETIDLKQALGRVLSAPVYAPINIPHDRNAAMDGYAFASTDIDHNQAFNLKLVGTSWAGRPYQGLLQTGQCIRIFTGAVVPEQADSVIMQEQVLVDGQNIYFPANAPTKQNVRAVGEDIKQTDCLLQAGKTLNACDLGLLAAAGIASITVHRLLKIACFSTGDELTALGQTLQPGKIYDSNRYLLTALLSNPFCQISDLGVLPDDLEQLSRHFKQAAENHDVIISTGGASVGDADYINTILTKYGTINFWKIAIKPGKPLAFGSIGNCYFFGLPGNPIAVITTFQQIVTPALKQLSGQLAKHQPLRFKATLTSAIKKAPGRAEFQRGLLTQDGNGNFQVMPSGKQGSHMLSSMSQANCYIVLPIECDGLQCGDHVIVEAFNTFI